MKFSVTVFILGLTVTNAISERVFLSDLNSDHERRNLDAGLPSTLHFHLKRQGHSDIKLQLEENRRLNAHAPVFETELTADGKQKMVKKSELPEMRSKFYHDKRNGGAFKVTCDNQSGGACQRKLVGNLVLDGRSYDLTPAPPMPSALPVTRGISASDDVPHVLIDSLNNEEKPKVSLFNRTIDDSVAIPDAESKRDQLLEELKSLLNQEQLDRIAKKMRRTSRKKRANNLYALEIVVAADPALWDKWYAMTTASNGLNRNDATELALRQHFAHLINGISLRYESIEDPQMDIYVTLSGFIFYKQIDSTNPLPPSTNIPVVNGVKYADGDVYIDSLKAWSDTLTGLPHNDHIAVFTGYELYAGSTSNAGVAGKAWVGGVCKPQYRTSINEDGSYYVTVSVATHELGHNLGASHDGSGSSSSCSGNSKYIMAPMVTSFGSGSTYTVNPWRFSSCAIAAFKTYVSGLGSSNCLLDHGDYYNENEYASHVSQMPGELHTPDQQCKLVLGDESGICSFQDMEDEVMCRSMLCSLPSGSCRYYAAARGTPCGQPANNKWCIEGLCVTRDSSHNGGGNFGGGGSQATNPPPTTTEATNTGGNGGGDSGGCIDRGWNDWTCGRVSDYFLANYNMAPSQWCTDPEWSYNCCALCNGGGSGAVAPPATTTTTTEAPSSDCQDIGWECASGHWSCQKLSDYFLANYNYGPTSWCRDPNWTYRCCVYCAGYGIY